MSKPSPHSQHPVRRKGWGRLGVSQLLVLAVLTALLVGLGYQWGHRAATVSAPGTTGAQAALNALAPSSASGSADQHAAGSPPADAGSRAGAETTAALGDVLSAPLVRRMSGVPYSELPPEGRDVLGRIVGSYDFDHDKDGTVFGNREGILPSQKRGYYREYTVPTPGLNHRGALRLVCGGQQPRQPNHCFYTADHYASFRQVVR